MATGEPDQTADRVGAVLALKPLAEAKSRLDLPPALRRRLALAMFLDTLAVVAGRVDATVVVSRQPALRAILSRAGIPATVRVLADRSDGLNAAFRQGEDALRAGGCQRVLACVGDLPTLRPDDLDRVIELSRGRPRSFVADASGVGTCLLISEAPSLDPRFQGESARAHADSGAEPLLPDDLGDRPGLRADVDTAEDLRRAVALGLGPSTRALIDPRTGELGRWQPVTIAQRPGTVITADGRRLRLRPGARPDGTTTPDGPDRLRPGQRLDAVTAGDEVLATWW